MPTHQHTPSIQSGRVWHSSEWHTWQLRGTLAFPPLNFWGGGGGVEKKSEYFVMADLYEDISRILAYEHIITWDGVVLHWWITPRSFQGQTRKKYLKYPLVINFKLFSGAVIHQKGLMVTHTWSGIISAHIFRKSRILILGGVMPPCCPY